VVSDPSTEPWPTLTFETLPWNSRYDRGAASRRDVARHTGSYNAAIVPEIAARDPGIPTEVAATAEDASVELARFDAEMGGEIAPFGSVLLRSESAASSQIENLTASARAIAEAELGETGRRNAAEIVANMRAMRAAIELADRLDADSVLTLHRALMDHANPAIAGRWRAEQVWIGGSALGPHAAVFVPPHHSRISAAIDDLMAFARRDDLPVLVQAAVAHAQFETIHPFVDGNGRVGRALLHSMLRSKRLTRNVTVPVSAGLLVDTSEYFDALTAYRAGDPAAIVDRLAAATFAAIGNGRQLVSELREIRGRWKDAVTARRDSAVWRVADLLICHPVVDARLLSRELEISARNTYRYIEPLVRAGVLIEFTDRRRGRAWRSAEVLAALDAFAAGAGRRTQATRPSV
jgi:Fic family protein